MDCVFRKIRDGALPATKVYEDGRVLAILDIHPLNDGHGLNVLQANGRAAFQLVPHFHRHRVPRWEGDGRGLNWELVPGQADRIRTVGERIRAHVRSREP